MGRDRERLAASVEEYIAETPESERKALEPVRSLVHEVVPDVSERIPLIGEIVRGRVGVNMARAGK